MYKPKLTFINNLKCDYCDKTTEVVCLTTQTSINLCQECIIDIANQFIHKVYKKSDVDNAIISAIEDTDDDRIPMGPQDDIWNGIYKALKNLDK
jgi:FixJ family two-component response regulator